MEKIEEILRKIDENLARIFSSVEVDVIEVPDEDAYCNAFDLSCDAPCSTRSFPCDVWPGELAARELRKEYDDIDDLAEMIEMEIMNDVETYAKLMAALNGCNKAIVLSHFGDWDWQRVIICPTEQEEKKIDEMIEYIEELERLLENVEDDDLKEIIKECYYDPTGTLCKDLPSRLRSRNYGLNQRTGP